MRGLALILLIAACKREPALQATQGGGDAGVATHVRLPKASDAPVRRTRVAMGRERLEKMAAIEHADFERQDRGSTATSVEFRHTTRTRPRLGVTVEIGACGPCEAIERSVQRRAEVIAELPAALRARAETQVEVFARRVAGATAVAVYKLGAAFGSDEQGQPAGDYVDAYELQYNDGVNRIRVVASYLDDAVGGVDRLRAVAPREDLEALAVAFFRFYVQQWQ